MKLSPNTVNILKNFATIQPNLIVNAGSTINHGIGRNGLAKQRLVLLECLNEFLTVYNLLEDPEVTFFDDHLTLTSGNSKMTYRFAETKNLTSPTKSIKLDEGDVTVNLAENQVASIRSAAAALGHGIVGFIGDGKKIKIVVHDPSGSNANKLEIDLEQSTDQTFELNCQVAEIKVLPGDYEVILSKKLLSKWVNKNTVVYYIALDTKSSFN